MQMDMAQKRGKLIGKLKTLNISAASFYGSSLWDLYSKGCERIYAAWNVAIRICFNVDRSTHRYLIEELSDSIHPKVML